MTYLSRLTPSAFRAGATERLALFLSGRGEEDFDWLELIGEANKQLVTPDLLSALERFAGFPVEAEAHDYLKMIAARNRLRNAALWQHAVEATRVLNQASIEPVLIKGVSKLARLPDPATSPRVLCDVDLLVPAATRERAEAVMKAAGYIDVGGPESAHSIGNYWKAGHVGQVDVHWRLPDGIGEVVSVAEIMAFAEPCTVGEVRFWLPDRHTALILTIAHEFLHDRALWRGTVALRYLLDLTAIPEDWSAFPEGPNARRALSHVGFALAAELQQRMAKHLFGCPGPNLSVTLRGRMLHERRLLKLRSPAVNRFEESLSAAYRGLGLRRHRRHAVAGTL